MLHTVKMQKVRIFALRKVLPSLIASLHESGMLEINREDFTGFEGGRPLEFHNVLSEQLVRLRAINSIIDKYAGKKHSGAPETIEVKEALKQSKDIGIEERLKSLVAEISAKETEAGKLRAQLAVVSKILPFTGIDFSKLETRTISFRIGEVAPEKLTNLKDNLDKELRMYNLIQPSGSKTALVLFQKTEKNVDQVLSSGQFNPLELPQGTTTPIQAKKALEAALSVAESRIKEVRSELMKTADSNAKKVRDLIYSLEIEADRAEIASRFGFSRSIAVFEGWIKKTDMLSLAKIAEKFGNDAMISDVGFSHEEMPPTVLGNPKIASPFEFITRSYSLPNYYEFDPTIFYLIGMPIILGMIVGDAVYGIATIFFALWLMKKFEKSYTMSNVAKIWLYTGFTSIIFGILFDEWGGFHQPELFEYLHSWGIPVPSQPLYEGFSRMHNLPLLIGLTAGLGMLHLAIGFIIGAINEWHHSKKHAFAKISWLCVEIGGALALLAMALHMIPAIFGTIGLGLLGISVVGLVLTEGIPGILELPGLVGNILSYARIAAVGVVGVVLAELINEAFAPKPAMGILIIFMIPIFLALHFSNLVLAIFEALIQGGRLNLIEFRSKFMKGGGREFAPFSMRSSNENK